ncbi:plakophilin-2 [Gadus chalcogrammus]|uniref:plakophilin-2 n=1 Tax=Gadus chalcogrammus TaxID=1042646 RepID=UPI0024C26B28|nr:plakophilin-2 [Gadus chalcogrammus]
MGDEGCFKSVLPPQVLDDSSLALPAEHSILSPARFHSVDRSVRVQQQVQLTLARKGKKSASNGSVHHAQRSLSWSSDYRDGPSHNSTLRSGSAFSPPPTASCRSLRRPSRRVEVSPAPSPVLPRPPLRYGAAGRSLGTYTIPGPGAPPKMAPLPERPYGSVPHKRYAFSEVPHTTRLHGATYSARRSPAHPGLQGPARTAPPPRRAAAGGGGLVQSHAPWETGTAERSRGVGLSWLIKARRELCFEGLDAASAVSMELDAPRGAEPESPVQWASGRAQKWAVKPPELTLERAVAALTQDSEDDLVTAASFIQKQCFSSADARKMVFYLHGIPKLLQLLPSDSEEVQRAAAGALRNLVFQSDENKMEVKESEGVALILRALRSCRDVEARRQLTGLLWNLSSHDVIKEHLSQDGFSVLTSKVLVPCSGLSEGENPKDELLADADTFHNATGCLRNLSSAGPDCRKAMRDCEDLIDALVYYIRGTIADYQPDDKATENCVCVLHNLSYAIESEIPPRFFRDLSEAPPPPSSTWSPGCFTHRPPKNTTDLERQRPLLEEKANPHGIEWLWSAITVRMYLSLMARSGSNFTQEAALGALQNITAGQGMLTEAICYTVVLRENGLQQVRRMLQEGDRSVRRTAVALVKNLSRYRELHAPIVKQVLPELVAMLPSSDQGTEVPTELTVCLCQILTNFTKNDTSSVKAIVNQGALPKVINISTKDNGFGPTRAGQAACLLLHTMWRHSDLHGAYRKAGYRKIDFVNSRTTKAVNSLQD